MTPDFEKMAREFYGDREWHAMATYQQESAVRCAAAFFRAGMVLAADCCEAAAKDGWGTAPLNAVARSIRAEAEKIGGSNG